MPAQPLKTPLCIPQPGSRRQRSIDAWASAACRKLVGAGAVLMGICAGSASAAVVTHSANFAVGYDFAAPLRGEIGYDYIGLSVKGNFGGS